MTIFRLRSTAGAVVAVAALLVAAGCATTPTSTPTPTPAKPEPALAAPAPTATPAGGVPSAPGAEPAPAEVPAAIAKPQAQKLALEAVDQLQNGDEAGARATLDRAHALDPGNELVRKLQEQIRADAQKELGPVFFRYTVQKDDTLSKLAQQFLGDRFRFYILAKYNDITNPSRLSAGQVLRIPGRAPPPGTLAPGAPGTPLATPEPAPPPPVAVPPRDEAADALAKAAQVERSGNAEAIYAAFAEVAQRYPNHAEAVKRRDAARANLVRTLDREASTAFQRQNLDLAIAKWDRVLEIDPNNKKARLERERASDLKRKLDKKFGAK